MKDIHNTALNNPAEFPENLAREMNKIDSQLTEILLAGERQYSKRNINRQPWSPALKDAALHFSY